MGGQEDDRYARLERRIVALEERLKLQTAAAQRAADSLDEAIRATINFLAFATRSFRALEDADDEEPGRIQRMLWNAWGAQMHARMMLRQAGGDEHSEPE